MTISLLPGTEMVRSRLASELTVVNADLFCDRWEVLGVPVVCSDDTYPYAQILLATRPVEFRDGIMMRGTLDLTLTTDATTGHYFMDRFLYFDKVTRMLAIFGFRAYVPDSFYKPSLYEKRRDGLFSFGRGRYLQSEHMAECPDPAKMRGLVSWLYEDKMFQSTAWREEGDKFVALIRETERAIDELSSAETTKQLALEDPGQEVLEVECEIVEPLTLEEPDREVIDVECEIIDGP